MNVDKNLAFPPAHQELIAEGNLSATSKLRRVKYFNNVVENDHKSVKCKSRYKQWYQSFADRLCYDQWHGNHANDTKRPGQIPGCG